MVTYWKLCMYNRWRSWYTIKGLVAKLDSIIQLTKQKNKIESRNDGITPPMFERTTSTYFLQWNPCTLASFSLPIQSCEISSNKISQTVCEESPINNNPNPDSAPNHLLVFEKLHTRCTHNSSCFGYFWIFFYINFNKMHILIKFINHLPQGMINQLLEKFNYPCIIKK